MTAESETATLAPAGQGEAGYLAPTAFVDSDHPAVAEFARRAAGDGADARQRALRLFYAVRDEIRYDPYNIRLTLEGLRASSCLEKGAGFCISKAVLLAACLRSEGIAARLGFADVRNHLATEKLRETMGTDLFVYHGYAEVALDGRWVKATPAFNKALCDKFGVLPLDWDGETDSLFHPFDADGRQHMEYVRERGSFADLPYAEIRAAMHAAYPHMFADGGEAAIGGDFGQDAEAELRRR